MVKVFIGHSKALDKRWVVKASNIEDATGKVVSFCKIELSELENEFPGRDIDVDISFTEMVKSITEI